MAAEDSPGIRAALDAALNPVSAGRYVRLVTISAAEFEAGYAARSGISVAELHALGRSARPCHCGADDCRGWQMVNAREWADASTAQDEVPYSGDHDMGSSGHVEPRPAAGWPGEGCER